MATVGKTNPHARDLRRNATDAEQRLWHHLRDRRLGGFKFRRQATIGPFIADFACVELKLIVEADGGQHGGPGDAERTRQLEALGWTIVRFWNNDILANTDGVLGSIMRAAEGRRPGPSPYPLPFRED